MTTKKPAMYGMTDNSIDVIFITGIGDTWKTTTASILARKFSIPVFYLDSYNQFLPRGLCSKYVSDLESFIKLIRNSCWECSHIIEGAHLLIQPVVDMIFETYCTWKTMHPNGNIHMLILDPPVDEWLKTSTRGRNEQYYTNHISKLDNIVFPSFLNPIRFSNAQDLIDYATKIAERDMTHLPYHDLPFEETSSKKQRRSDCKERLQAIKSYYDLTDKTGIDLGCNIGGITFGVAMSGAKHILGIDGNQTYIDTALELEARHRTGANFRCGDIINFLDQAVVNKDHYDFCLYLSVMHWILKLRGVKTAQRTLKNIARVCDTMFLENSLGDSPAGDAVRSAGIDTIDSLISFVELHSSMKFIKSLGNPGSTGTREILVFSHKETK